MTEMKKTEFLRDRLVEYYKDQVSYYTNRKKEISNHIKTKEKIGLPVSKIDKLKLAEECINVKRNEDFASYVSSADKKSLKNFLDGRIANSDYA